MRAPFQMICGSRSGSRSRTIPADNGRGRGYRTGPIGSISSCSSAADWYSAVGMLTRDAVSAWLRASTFLRPFAFRLAPFFVAGFLAIYRHPHCPAFGHSLLDQLGEGFLNFINIAE